MLAVDFQDNVCDKDSATWKKLPKQRFHSRYDNVLFNIEPSFYLQIVIYFHYEVRK